MELSLMDKCAPSTIKEMSPPAEETQEAPCMAGRQGLEWMERITHRILGP